MRKVVLGLHASLDGMVEGPKGVMDIGWVSYDENLEKFAQQIFSTVDTILWGRATFVMMQQYWPTVPSNPTANEFEKSHAAWLDQTQKIVFSNTLTETDWVNSSIVNGDLTEILTNLKQQPGQDMVVMGSPRLAHQLMRLGLVDEIKMTISPVVVGGGLPMFKDLTDMMKLKLVQSQTYSSGAISLIYEVVRS